VSSGRWKTGVPAISCSPTGAARPHSCRSFDSASRSTRTFFFSCFIFYSRSRPRHEASSPTRFSFIAAGICPGLSCCGRSRSGASPVCQQSFPFDIFVHVCCCDLITGHILQPSMRSLMFWKFCGTLECVLGHAQQIFGEICTRT
jgi:hypothetical protein